MVLEKIKSNWDRLWEDGTIHYFPESNKELLLTDGLFPIKVKYAPERANRIVNKKPQALPLGTDIWTRKDCLYEFNKLVLLANNRPVCEYHSILCSKLFHAQNEILFEEICEISQIVEQYDLRGFLNLVGTAATLNHFHAQIITEPFNMEGLKKKKVNDNCAILEEYPGANILITGTAEERCNILFEIIGRAAGSALPSTEKKDGSYADSPLFTLLFWSSYILFIPRKREWSSITRAMVGGLELSGYFLFASADTPEDPFKGITHAKMMEVIQDVTFGHNEMKFLYK
ncbi:hypothetical protein [Lacrimispora sp. 38-1]|uniref:hypothetical protein n=1 Tax=Lacrimispora sp. 38-1 TaxID=3125778 RepID=UPI003CF6D8CE